MPFLLALIIGGLGGLAFSALRLPLPWMLGPMTFCVAAVLAGLPLGAPRNARPPTMMVIGVMLGSTYTMDIVRQMPDWLPIIGGLVVLCILAALLNGLYYRYVAGFDLPTAYFSAMPGGLVEMSQFGEKVGGDTRQIALAHSSRLFLVVMTLPWLIALLTGFVPGTRTVGSLSATDVPLSAYFWFAACLVAGALLGRALRLPAYAILGPLIVSAIIHVAGISDFKTPREILIAAQLVLGIAVGTSFRGVPARIILLAMAHTFGAVAILLVLTFGVAYTVAGIAGQPTELLVLAFAPGGFAEMSIIALALGLDVALVAGIHVIRITLMILFAPPGYRLLLRVLPARTAAIAAAKNPDCPNRGHDVRPVSTGTESKPPAPDHPDRKDPL